MSTNEQGDRYEQEHGYMTDMSRWREWGTQRQMGGVHTCNISGSSSGRWDTENEQGPA